MNKKLIVAVAGVGGLALAGKLFSKKKVKNVKPISYDGIIEDLSYHSYKVLQKTDQVLATTGSETAEKYNEGTAIINDANNCIKNAEEQVLFMKAHVEEFDDVERIKDIENAIWDLNGYIYELNSLRANITII